MIASSDESTIAASRRSSGKTRGPSAAGFSLGFVGFNGITRERGPNPSSASGPLQAARSQAYPERGPGFSPMGNPDPAHQNLDWQRSPCRRLQAGGLIVSPI